ncbi:hypothetical protein PFICI_14135 [Pestalotiopsis fici W106-1]|uniref:Uncharacterized protein n=1 Tax=Pestalotiopsis fici (strain W106-1 / CGMCC3.15140) TaxID=1229662 RepID=W3WKL7_PESFW|nr:uncharacterized protein PFICI_14135 [Pestalotiopsis fici W106-1]ETS74269.1 hypothetical protein PFICI_14135 [Pestalotiopsis fici W106-1]
MCTHVMNHWQGCHHKAYLYTETCAAAQRRGGREVTGRFICSRGDANRTAVQFGDRHIPTWMRGCRHRVEMQPAGGLPDCCEDCTRIHELYASIDADMAADFADMES